MRLANALSTFAIAYLDLDTKKIIGDEENDSQKLLECKSICRAAAENYERVLLTSKITLLLDCRVI